MVNVDRLGKIIICRHSKLSIFDDNLKFRYNSFLKLCCQICSDFSESIHQNLSGSVHSIILIGSKEIWLRLLFDTVEVKMKLKSGILKEGKKTEAKNLLKIFQ